MRFSRIILFWDYEYNVFSMRFNLKNFIRLDNYINNAHLSNQSLNVPLLPPITFQEKEKTLRYISKPQLPHCSTAEHIAKPHLTALIHLKHKTRKKFNVTNTYKTKRKQIDTTFAFESPSAYSIKNLARPQPNPTAHQKSPLNKHA